jgi:hypothetical protein
MQLAKNVGERGVLKIAGLVAKYGLQSFLEAVFLEVHELAQCDDEEAKRVEDKLLEIILPGIEGEAK